MAQYDGSHVTRIERQLSSTRPELPFIPQRMYQDAALKRVLRQYYPQVHLETISKSTGPPDIPASLTKAHRFPPSRE